jgi:hypothetical protein
MRRLPLLALLAVATLARSAGATPPADLVAPLADAELDAYLENRFVALAKEGASKAAVEGALSRGVASGALRGNSAAASDAPSLANAALGVVSFKFATPPASPNAAAAVRARAACVRLHPRF